MSQVVSDTEKEDKGKGLKEDSDSEDSKEDNEEESEEV